MIAPHDICVHIQQSKLIELNFIRFFPVKNAKAFFRINGMQQVLSNKARETHQQKQNLFIQTNTASRTSSSIQNSVILPVVMFDIVGSGLHKS